MSATTRAEKLNWLKNAPQDKNICRVLNNVRCLSEGVDVPVIDFLASAVLSDETANIVGT